MRIQQNFFQAKLVLVDNMKQ